MEKQTIGRFMKIRFAQLAMLMLLIIFLAGAAAASEPIVLSADVEEFSLGLNYDFIEDKEKKWSIRDVSNGPASELFIAAKRPNPIFGVSSSSFWLRFTIHNPLKADVETRLESFYAMVDIVNLYIPNNIGGFIEKQVGDSLPMSAREIEHPHLIFDVLFPAGETVTLYLRAESELAFILPFHLVTKEKFEEKDNLVWIFFKVYFGILLLLGLYNFIMYLYLRDISCFNLTMLILIWTLTSLTMNRLDDYLLWPESTLFPAESAGAIILLTITLAMEFTRTFLSTNRLAPQLDTILGWHMRLCMFILLLSFVFSDHQYLAWTIFASLLVCFSLILYAGGMLWRNKILEARLFLVAWIMVILFFTVFTLSFYGVIPYNFLTAHSIDTGGLIAVILLSLSLVDKRKIMRTEP